MKRTLLAFALLAAAAPSAWSDPFDEFRARANNELIKPFALDLGGVLGGAAFHSGRTLGMPGFDVTVNASLQFKPGHDNLIFKNAGVDAFGLPSLQVAVGLPFKLDAIAQGFTASGVKVFGGGLRWGLHKSAKISPMPDVSVSGFADKVDHDAFKATHYSLNATASVGLPIFKPYAGLGWDVTTVEVQQAATPGLAGFKATARGMRLTGGVDISPLPLLHVYGAYTLRHGESGADLGLGVRF